MRFIGSSIVIQNFSTQFHPWSSLIVDRQTGIQTLETIFTHFVHTRLVYITYRSIEFSLFITTRNIYIMTVRRSILLQHQISPVRMTIIIHGTVQHFIFRIVSRVICIILHFFHRIRIIHHIQIGICHCPIYKFGMLPTCTYHFRQYCRFGKCHITGIRHSSLHIRTCILRCYQNNTISSTYTIDGRCSRIFQYRNVGNVIRINHIEIHLHTVNQHQWATTVNRSSTTHIQCRSGTRLTTTRRNLQVRYSSLQCAGRRSDRA